MTAIDEPKQVAFPIQIFPNPAQDRVQVQVAAHWDEPLRIRAFDALGRLLRDYGSDFGKMLDLSGLLPGVVFLRVESDGQVWAVRLIKAK